MPNLLQTIAADRAHIARVVTILDHELDALRDPSSDPDYRLLADILNYFRHYPTSVHYPNEDLVYSYLAEIEPAHAAMVEDLRRQHERQAGLAEDLFRRFEGIAAGNVGERGRLAEDADAYVALIREHMAPEDDALYEAAAARLGGEELAALETRAAEQLDPSIRKRIEQDFGSLLQSIEEDFAAEHEGD
ncbi:MAG: hemerythrin domain-containing protein [Gammaproteobacteria bacterium]